MPIRFVRYNNTYDNQPKAYEAPTLADAIADLEISSSVLPMGLNIYRTGGEPKKALPLYSFATYLPGAERANAGVESVTAAVFDIDGALEDDLLAWIQHPQCPIRELEAYAYTTISHGFKGQSMTRPDGVTVMQTRYRLIVALSRPVTPSEWDRVFGHVATHWNIPQLDTSVRDAARMFIVPIEDAPENYINMAGHPDVRPSTYECLVPGDWPWQGTYALDVDRILATTPEPPSGYQARGKQYLPPPGLREATRAEIYGLIDRATRGIRELQKRLMMRSLINGEAFCTPGTSHDALMYATAFLVPRLSHVDTRSIIEFLRPGLDAQDRAGSTINYPDLELMIEGARTKLDRVPTEATTKAVLQAFGQQKNSQVTLPTSPVVDPETGNVTDETQGFGSNPGEKYSPAEMIKCAELAGVDPMSHPDTWPWIVRTESTFWFLTAEGYVGGFGPKVSSMNRERNLKRAPIMIQEWTGGESGKWETQGLERIAEQFGVTAQFVVDDLAGKTRWDPEAQAMFREAAPRDARIAAQYHPDVAHWLGLLFADDVEAGLDWIAAFPMLDRPTRVLSLAGKRNTGKTLLANGLAKVWVSGRPTKLGNLTRQFNAQAASQPLCFADETIGDLSQAQLRQLVGGGVDNLERKFQESSTVRGNLRFMIAANDVGHLASPEVTEAEAQRAVADRFLHFVITEAPAKYLATIPHERKAEFFDYAIAETCLWFAENRALEQEGRFLGRAGGVNITKELVVLSEGPATALEIILEWLDGPQHAQPGMIRVHEGAVYVSRRFINDKWNELHGRPPKTSTLSMTMRAIGEQAPRRVFEGTETKRVVYHRIDADLLKVSAERNGSIDTESVVEILTSPDKFRKGTPPPTRVATVTQLADHRSPLPAN